MNIKIKLEDEPIFNMLDSYTKRKIKKLKEKGINTVEDFINRDLLVDPVYSDKDGNLKIKAFQSILKYKYLNKVLTNDIFLETEYHGYQSMKTFYRLGFEGVYNKYAEILKEKKEIRIIDVLESMALRLDNSQAKDLAQFYVDYYKKEIKKEYIEDKTGESSLASNKKELEKYKDQLISLLIERNKLDEKINNLTEKVRLLQEGDITNAKK